jgi:RNA polymerase sigma-70 factor (ECF subfamily)
MSGDIALKSNWVVRRRMEENEVVPVIGLKTLEWGGRDGRGQDSPARDGVSESPLLTGKERQEESEWQRQTLKHYDDLNPQLYRYLRGNGISKDEAEDVIQESFLRLAQHLKRGGPEDNLRAWIFQVAHNLAMDIHRASRRKLEEPESEHHAEKEPSDPDANPESAYLQKEQSRRLEAAMSQLTSQQYNSILLRAEGLRYREIGEVLKVSEQRAIHLVKRGLQRLAGGL